MLETLAYLFLFIFFIALAITIYALFCLYEEDKKDEK